MNVYQRMHYAGCLMQHRLAKEGKNTFQNYKYVTHDDVAEAVRGPLQEARLVVTFSAPTCELSIVDQGAIAKTSQVMVQGVVEMRVINIDNPSDVYALAIPAYALDGGDKAYCKLISYAKKCGLLALCGLLLPTGEDADAESPSAPRTAPTRPPKHGTPPPRPRATPQEQTAPEPIEEGDDPPRANAAAQMVEKLKPQAAEHARAMGLLECVGPYVRQRHGGRAMSELTYDEAVGVCTRLQQQHARYTSIVGALVSAGRTKTAAEFVVTAGLIDCSRASHEGNPMLGEMIDWVAWERTILANAKTKRRDDGADAQEEFPRGLDDDDGK
jgi:hypothetical protein